MMRPSRPAPRHDHGGLRGRGADLRRDRRGGVLPHGGIAGEVVELATYGIPAEDALGPASWRAREWLGLNATLDEGAPADFVVYDADPLRTSACWRPARVVLRGRVVA